MLDSTVTGTGRRQSSWVVGRPDTRLSCVPENTHGNSSIETRVTRHATPEWLYQGNAGSSPRHQCRARVTVPQRHRARGSLPEPRTARVTALARADSPSPGPFSGSSCLCATVGPCSLHPHPHPHPGATLRSWRAPGSTVHRQCRELAALPKPVRRIRARTGVRYARGKKAVGFYYFFLCFPPFPLF